MNFITFQNRQMSSSQTVGKIADCLHCVGTIFVFVIVRDEVYVAEQPFYTGASCFPTLDSEATMACFLGSQYDLPPDYERV